jgi:hypothetical protein
MKKLLSFAIFIFMLLLLNTGIKNSNAQSIDCNNTSGLSLEQISGC